MYQWISDLVKVILQWFVDQTIDLIIWLLPWAMEVGCTVIEQVVAAIALPGEWAAAVGAWASLPPQMVYIVNAIGIPQAISLWVGALTIRITLNFLPSWLTRI